MLAKPPQHGRNPASLMTATRINMHLERLHRPLQEWPHPRHGRIGNHRCSLPPTRVTVTDPVKIQTQNGFPRAHGFTLNILMDRAIASMVSSLTSSKSRNPVPSVNAVTADTVKTRVSPRLNLLRPVMAVAGTCAPSGVQLALVRAKTPPVITVDTAAAVTIFGVSVAALAAVVTLLNTLKRYESKRPLKGAVYWI